MVRCIVFAAFPILAVLGCGRSTTPSPPETPPADAGKSPGTTSETHDPVTNVSETKTLPQPTPGAQTSAGAEKPPRLASRTWTDASGKFKVEAELVEIKGDTVVLKKGNGNTTTVAISKLSKPDQDFVTSIKQPSATVESRPSQSPIPNPKPKKSETENAPEDKSLLVGTFGDDTWEVRLVLAEFFDFPSRELRGSTPTDCIVVALRAKCVKPTTIPSGAYAFLEFKLRGATEPLKKRGISPGPRILRDGNSLTVVPMRGMLGMHMSGDRQVGYEHEFVAVLELDRDAADAASKVLRLEVLGLLPGIPKFDLPEVTLGRLEGKP